MTVRCAWRERPLRIALYSGLSVTHDAISNSLRLKLEVFEQWRAEGALLDWTAFVQHSDQDDPHVVSVGGVAELICRPEFHADVHIFEFGIAYALFDAVFLLPSSRTASVYHNVTPVDLVDDVWARGAIERSQVQKHNLCAVGRIASVSEFNREDLLALGIERERISVLHLPPGCADLKPSPKRNQGPIEVLFVGRFVRAKGVLDLLAAFEDVTDAGRPVRLTLVGNPTFADGPTREALHSASVAMPDRIRIAAGVDDAALADLYREAHVFVMPSYHEGYCVPVIEAFGAGCQVVAYSAGNLPSITSGLAQLVEPGDIVGLAQAIQRAVAGQSTGTVITSEGPMDARRWRDRVERHVEAHSRAAYEQGLSDFIAGIVDGLPATVCSDAPTAVSLTALAR